MVRRNTPVLAGLTSHPFPATTSAVKRTVWTLRGLARLLERRLFFHSRLTPLPQPGRQALRHLVQHHLRLVARASQVTPSLLVSDCLHQRALGGLVQPVELSHVVAVELEAVEVCVLLDARGRVALGQRHEAALQAPADEHLGDGHAVFLRDALQCWVRGFLVADQRAVGFDDDVVVLAVLDCVLLLAPGVELGCVSIYE